jgi:putative flippase GtrA
VFRQRPTTGLTQVKQLASRILSMNGLAVVGYLVAGGLSLLLDIATLFVMHGLMHIPLIVAVSIAYLVGLFSNYSINRYWVFSGGGESLGRSAFRYGLLVAFNYSATVVIVAGLTSAGFSYIVGKLIAVGGTLIWNYLAYKHWVFSPKARSMTSLRPPGGGTGN